MRTTATAIRSHARPASGYWTYPDAGISKKENSSGKQKRTADAQAVRQSENHFLTVVFENIPVSRFSPIYSPENYDYLYRSAKNYAALMGKEFHLERQESNFDRLYKTFDALLPNNQYVDIIKEKNKLRLKISDNRREGLLYFVPCRIIDNTEGELKDIYISFFSLFHHTQGLTAMGENIIFEYIAEELPENPNEIAQDDEWSLLLNNYQNGKIGETLNLVDTKSIYSVQELQQKIENYLPQSEDEKKILDLMNQGLDLFSLQKSILHYAYEPYDDVEEEDCQEYYPISMDRIITIVYDADDSVSESMFDWVSQEANEQGFEFLSSGSIVLSPQTKQLIEIDPYVEEFLNWINTFSYELCNL